MPNSFVEYVYRRLLNEADDVGTEAPAPGQDTTSEKKQKVKNIQTTFAQARQDLAKMVDDKFADLNAQLTKSFGSQQKVDSVARNQIVQVLGKIANKIASWGDQEQGVQYAAPEAEKVPARVPPVAAEGIHQVHNLLIEAEVFTEDNSGHQMKVKAVSAHLDGMKREIMQKVDDTLKALQNDAVMKMMTDIHKNVSAVQGIVSGQSPLNATEKIDAYHNMQQLGNVIAMQAGPKLKFGERAPKSASPIQIILGGGHALSFNPGDRTSIMTAMSRLKNPRNVKIKVGEEIETVDISNKQQMADVISRAQETMGQGDAQLAAADKVAGQSNNPLKTAREPRKKMFPVPGQKPQMPVALGPGVGGGDEEV